MGIRIRWLVTYLCAALGLAGCASQSPSFTPEASGTLNSTAQILGDLTFLFK